MAWVLTSNNFDVWLAYDLSGVSIDEFADGVTDGSWDKFLASTSWNTLDDFTQFIDENAISAEHSASEPATTYPSKIWVDTDAQGQSFYQADKGFCNRPLFEYKDADEVTVYSGAYYLAGSLTPGRFCFWNTSFDIAVTATTGWNYLYILDAACSSLVDGEPLTSTCFSFSVTAPTWDDNRRGWYDSGYNRCIFATYCGTASTQSEFHHDGGDNISWDAHVVLASNITPGTTWTNVTCRIPTFCDRIDMTVFSIYVNAATYTYWRIDGSSGTGHICGHVNAGKTGEVNSIANVTTNGGIFEIHWAGAGSNQISIYQNSWYFPRGM